jgi:hypothetical protein
LRDPASQTWTLPLAERKSSVSLATPAAPAIACANRASVSRCCACIAWRSSTELHHYPSAAEDGLAAVGFYNPKLINVQIPELRVGIERITHHSPLCF